MSALQNLCDSFSVTALEKYFRTSIPSLKLDDVNYDFLFEDNENLQDFFTDIQKLGEADLPNGEDLFVFTAKTNFSLTDRSSKKRQYDIAKKILKEEVKDAAFFIFYDDVGQFRFSFIRADVKGTKRDYTTFKRYTYFISHEQTNQTFVRQLSGCNFQDLEEIQTAFSVEPLNKEFYQKIAKAFYQLIGGKVSEGSKDKEYKACLKLPDLDTKKDHRTYQEFAVRFIGRTIFIWFLKNKTSDAGLPLIPSEWLSSGKVGATKDYYHNLLEKLFFEILNTPIEDRIDSLPDEHTTIPFLNGGLFEPQNEDFYTTVSSGSYKSSNTLKIPDTWILDLFEMLEQFNFTIDENTLTDMEVSIDPEMLGTIFENLLAEIDPDTEKSARKSTGSFYTPREIVDHMVVESLVAYLETISRLSPEVLKTLFQDDEYEEQLLDHRTILLDAFDAVKILDPACGSGAYPMGALQKINLALQKLDPDATLWKEKQLSKVENVQYRKALKNKLDNSSVDYIRKIGILQHSIYGVDIQPIATEISKLRGFLSLIVDEKIDDMAPNRGIFHLPNLEFKFVTANSLQSLHDQTTKSTHQKGVGFDFSGVSQDIEELQDIRDQYLGSFGDEKDKLKDRYIETQSLIANKENSSKSAGGNKKAKQIIQWNPFLHKKANWFDSKWMFGVESFDIVIGNPPWGAKIESHSSIQRFGLGSNADSSEYFISLAFELANKLDGIVTLIVPKSILFAKKWDVSRRKILDNILLRLTDAGVMFENVNLESIIFQSTYSKTLLKTKVEVSKFVPVKRYIPSKTLVSMSPIPKEFMVKSNVLLLSEFSELTIGIISKIQARNEFLSGIGREVYRGLYIPDKVKDKILGSGSTLFVNKVPDVSEYSVDNVSCVKLENYVGRPENKIEKLKTDRIIVKVMRGKKLTCAFAKRDVLTTEKLVNLVVTESSYHAYYILAVLNSLTASFYLEKALFSDITETSRVMDDYYLRVVPLPIIGVNDQRLLVSLVEQILDTSKNTKQYSDLQKKINEKVFDIYKFTTRERDHIRGYFNIEWS